MLYNVGLTEQTAQYIMTITILDGGMGQELMARSNAEATALWSAATMRDEPDLVKAVHADFFNAGAEIATTNSYILHRDRLAKHGAEDQFKDIHVLACELACQARDEHGSGRVAGGMGPTGRSYRPDLAMEVDEAAEVYAEIAAIQAPFVDLLLLETMASVKQAEGAVRGASVVGLPVWLGLTVDDSNGSVLRSGEPLTDALVMASRYQVDAVLINCSTPEAVTQSMAIMSDRGGRYGAYANGFTKISEAFKQAGATVDELTARQDLSPARYLEFADGWVDSGASIVGGCCEVGPEHIRKLANRFESSF